MYLTALPDHSRPGFDEQKHFSMFGNTNIIFNAQSNKAGCDKHVGCLSLKTVLSGEEWYGVGGRSVSVKPGAFLLLNNGQDYSCRIDRSARTVSVFFANDFARSVFTDFTSTAETVTDEPFETSNNLPEFFQVLHELNDTIKEDILSLIRLLDQQGYQTNVVDEQLVLLLHNILTIHRKDIAASESILAARLSTRKEIYKRICVAREMLEAAHRNNPSLKQVALASSLSVPQLVRQFNAVFGTTPHQYLMGIRLKEAAQLLRSTETPVAEIALTCGFEDASTFARSFRNKYKLSPVQFRLEIR